MEKMMMKKRMVEIQLKAKCYKKTKMFEIKKRRLQPLNKKYK